MRTPRRSSGCLKIKPTGTLRSSMPMTPGRREEVCRVGELQVRGVHNIENAMAAAAVAGLAGCPAEVINRGLRTFRGLEHVMEVVRVLHEVTYINDSKGTNVD